MRPSRYFPNKLDDNNHDIIIDNLVYVINSMLENEYSCKDGIGMIIYMNNWIQKDNFTSKYFYQLFKILQGAIPVRIRLCLLINPPKWFTKIWNVMKHLLNNELKSKIILINENELSKYLKTGFESFLPDDMDTGTLSTNDIVNDYITYRKYIENLNEKQLELNMNKITSTSTSTIPVDTASILDNISFNGYNRTYNDTLPTTNDNKENTTTNESNLNGSSNFNNYVVQDGQIRVDELLVVPTGEQLEV